MKVFVTGINGQLGHDVMLALQERGHEAIGSGSGAKYLGEDSLKEQPYVCLNTTHTESVDAILREICPDAVIHCSAWTAVDLAEEEENQRLVRDLNVTGPKNIAKACNSIGAKMMYISTDYVFDGKGEIPWEPDCKSFAPQNVYGQTKLEGEKAVAASTEKYFVVRSEWLFGTNGNNFVRTMISVGKTHETVRVVNDQIGTPTYTKDLARLLAEIIESEKYGYYHAVNSGGYVSWYDFCCEFYRQYGLKTTVLPVSTEEYGRNIAARPFNSRLDTSKLQKAGFQSLPDWRDAVKRFLQEAEF